MDIKRIQLQRSLFLFTYINNNTFIYINIENFIGSFLFDISLLINGPIEWIRRHPNFQGHNNAGSCLQTDYKNTARAGIIKCGKRRSPYCANPITITYPFDTYPRCVGEVLAHLMTYGYRKNSQSAPAWWLLALPCHCRWRIPL